MYRTTIIAKGAEENSFVAAAVCKSTDEDVAHCKIHPFYFAISQNI